MSNIRRMLMMLAQDLPKRESICGVEEYDASNIPNFIDNSYFSTTSNVFSPSDSNNYGTAYIEVNGGDIVDINMSCYPSSTTQSYFEFNESGNVVSYGKGETIYFTRIVNIGSETKYFGFNIYKPKQRFVIKYTRTLSQEAYDYALSFGKKCVKDLKKAIDASDNPAMLIKRINDWKYLIHSLVDTGYTSWLKGDGSAYVDTGIIASSEAMLDMVVTNFDIDSQSSKWSEVFGYRKNDYPPLYVSLYGYNGGSITNYIWCKTRSSNKSMMSVTKNDIVRCYVDNSKLYQYKNGILSNSVSKYNGDSVVEDNTFYLFTANNNGVPRGISDVYVRYCDVILNDNHSTFVPYYNGSEYCMLDINSGVIYENANVVDGEKVGAFGFVVTDADGDEYEDFCDIEGNRIVTTLNDGEVLCLHQHIPAYYIGENKTTIYREPNTSYEFTDDGLLVYGSDVNIGFAPTNSILLIDGHKYLNIYRMKGVIEQLRFNDGSKRYITISSVNNNEITTKSNIFIKTETTSRKVYQISWNATENSTTWVYAQAIDLTLLFGEANVPTTAEEVYNIIHTENMNDLWYIPPTSTPIPLIVVCGSLHYALNKSVRDYAEEKGKLNELNTYCCENKDAIAIFNADKTKVDTLLE